MKVCSLFLKFVKYTDKTPHLPYAPNVNITQVKVDVLSIPDMLKHERIIFFRYTFLRFYKYLQCQNTPIRQYIKYYVHLCMYREAKILSEFLSAITIKNWFQCAFRTNINICTLHKYLYMHIYTHIDIYTKMTTNGCYHGGDDNANNVKCSG